MPYRVVLRDPLTEDIYELLPSSFGFVEELNTESTASFEFSFEQLENDVTNPYATNPIDLFSGNKKEIYIEKLNNGSYQKIYYGLISQVNISPGSEGDKKIVVESADFLSVFTKRRAGIPVRHFVSTDAGEIAWTLIDESQQSDPPYSDVGITEGTIEASKDRDRTYKFDIIKDSIINLSNNNLDDGFDFEINTDKEFNVFYPEKGTTRNNVVFDERSYAGWSFSLPLYLMMTNKVFVLGETGVDTQLYETVDAADIYKEPFGLLEDVSNEGDVSESATLIDKGTKRILNEREPIIEYEFEHYDEDDKNNYFTYSIGDRVPIDMPDLGMDLDLKRIIKREFSVSQDKEIALLKIKVV